jgi:DNA invertase Pin-like site-specific DNA recombinase
VDRKIKAYSYLRISTEAQTIGDGIRRQMEASRLYAKEQGYDLVETMSDLGVSGFKGENAKEGALGRFLAAVEAGDISSGSVLIVESLDRLSRDRVIDAFSQFTQILKSGISIVTLIDGQVYTSDSISQNPAQLFMSLGIMLRANDESITKSNRIGAAWQRKRDSISSQKLTKTSPAWLILKEDRRDFLVRPRAAETVRTIFELCINGMGVYSITRHLNANLEKYPPITTATRWNDSYIAKILRNPAVYGRFQAHKRISGKMVPVGEEVPNYYPEIVDEATFYLAQSAMQKRRTVGAGRKGDVFSNLFSNLIKCGKCGGSVLMKNKGKPPKGHKYLRCHNSLIN